ncbi:MAG: alginate lyase family protein [Pyrinomonadaceae bacterium]
MKLTESLQELREMGVNGSLFRFMWELKMRTGLIALSNPKSPALITGAHQSWASGIPFTEPSEVREAMRDRIAAVKLEELPRVARDAANGRILYFGKWHADFGVPINWNLNPVNGRSWKSSMHWSQSLVGASDIGDIKYTWEIARFPHAYHMTRAAAFDPATSVGLAQSLEAQIQEFIKAAPPDRGVHWYSSQEIVFRLVAWLFAYKGLLNKDTEARLLEQTIAKSVVAGAIHIEHHIGYSRYAVYNNHLLAEALGLFIAGTLFPSVSGSRRWRELGLQLLCEQSERQIYRDGAYIQQSHNYHRVALQMLLVAWMFMQHQGEAPPECWSQSLARSLDFLIAHQNPPDGRLPNYGFNDGALPLILSTCDFSDFRPTLQAVSVAVRGERIYEPGAWDEEAVWFYGAKALAAPLRPRKKKSVSFTETGYHVLRGRDAANFCAFRCGSIRDRFSQIDMLHLDVWWRGLNMLVDGGSYSYNDSATWHNYFMRTASHNTVMVDRHDQMLHYRRFKCLYWTQAKLLRFEDHPDYAICAGEHYGFQRFLKKCVHRRCVLFLKDDLWIVVDKIYGSGTHDVRLHWLCGDFQDEHDKREERLTLTTPEGLFSVQVYDEHGQRLPLDIAAGQEHPPRGWVSRYYGEKRPTPSLTVETRGQLPLTLVSILGAGSPVASVQGTDWCISEGTNRARFQIQDGLILFNEIPK